MSGPLDKRRQRHEDDDSCDNEVGESTREALQDWFLTLHQMPKPALPPLRCPECGGNLYPEPDIPGLLEIRCLQCSRLIGELLESDLAAWAGQAGAQRVHQTALTFLWVRGDD